MSGRSPILPGMSFLPDPAELEAIAERIGRHATATRARAAQLGAAAATVDWRGVASDAFAAEAHVALSALRRAAGRLDDAAEALRRHAAKVEGVFDDLRGLGADGRQTLEDAVTHPERLLTDGKRLVADGKHLVGDALGLVGL
jgi:uncharacterized protein YukE